MSNSKKRRPEAEDIAVGKILWLSYLADNGESSVVGPAKIESIEGGSVFLKFLGEPQTIGGKRFCNINWPQEYVTQAIEEGTVSLPDPAELEEHIKREQKWIKYQQTFLTQYSAALESASPKPS